MPSLDLAARCRRLAREMMGDPIEAALLRVAEECEAATGCAYLADAPDRRMPRGGSMALGAEHYPQRA